VPTAQQDAAQSRPNESAIRLAIVDDHPVIRGGLKMILAQWLPQCEVVGEADEAAAALSLTRRLEPQLVILDLTLGQGAHGFELIRELRALADPPRILVFSVHEEEVYAERCLLAGAHGFIQKRAPLPELIRAVTRVSGGQVYLSQDMQERVLTQQAPLGPSLSGRDLGGLSNRELHIFELLGRGMSPRQIAQHLSISVKTSQVHRHNIKTKLGFETSRELDRFATAWMFDQGGGATMEAARPPKDYDSMTVSFPQARRS
jgi:DNA-binding NarL/FixJ family response regulator